MAEWTVGQEVTIEKYDFTRIPKYVHTTISRVLKNSIVTETKDRFTLDGIEWGGDRYFPKHLLDRSRGLKREADTAEKRRTHNLRAQCREIVRRLDHHAANLPDHLDEMLSATAELTDTLQKARGE